MCSYPSLFRDLSTAELDFLTAFARPRSLTGVAEIWATHPTEYRDPPTGKKQRDASTPRLSLLRDDWLKLRAAWRERVDRAVWAERYDWAPWYFVLVVLATLMLRSTWSLAIDGDELHWLMLIFPTVVLFGVGFSLPGWSGLRLLAVALVPLGALAMAALGLLRFARRPPEALEDADPLDP